MAILAGWLVRPRLVLSAPHKSIPVMKGSKKKRSAAFKTIDYFLHENVNYDISFLWFRKAAVGSLKFEREGDGYKAVLEAETRGVVGFFTSYRKHRYVSHLSYMPERDKFLVSLFERYVIIGKRVEKTFTWLDYDSRVIGWKDYKNGKVVEDKSEPIPDKVEYDDILSAFYNFRMGVYGPIERGRNFRIRTMPEKGKSSIDVNITTREEAIKKRRLFGDAFDSDLFHLSVRVPKEIFKSRTGEVSILFDEEILPIQGVVRDYIGFGDVRGVLRRA